MNMLLPILRKQLGDLFSRFSVGLLPHFHGPAPYTQAHTHLTSCHVFTHSQLFFMISLRVLTYPFPPALPHPLMHSLRWARLSLSVQHYSLPTWLFDSIMESCLSASPCTIHRICPSHDSYE